MNTPTREEYIIKPGPKVTPDGRVLSTETRRIYNKQGRQIGWASFDEDRYTINIVRYLDLYNEYHLTPMPCDSADQMDELIRQYF